jgi:CubicO group peptidase (beta-lactamase class C family)
MKKLTSKALTILVMLGIFTFSTIAWAADGQCNKNGEVKQKLHAYFEQLAADRIFSGAVLVARDGHVLLKDGFGLADYDTGEKNKPKTVYGIGSLTKAFTVMSIMMLEERGLLNVTDTLDKYIPGFINGDMITLHHLMNHTSGMFEYINDPTSTIWEFGLEKLALYHTPGQLLDYFIDRPPYFEPGEQWSYCNSAFVVLGIIIEQVSGMSYSDFIEKNILKPLHMKDTIYDPLDLDLPRQAIGYNDVLTDPPCVAPLLHPSIAYSAGGIFSTVEDMFKWDQALYTDRLVSHETLNKIFAPGLGDYGYGWFIDTLEITGQPYKQIWHWGSTLGYHSLISRLVDEKVTLILLHNTNAPNDSFEDQEMMRHDVYEILFNPGFTPVKSALETLKQQHPVQPQPGRKIL